VFLTSNGPINTIQPVTFAIRPRPDLPQPPQQRLQRQPPHTTCARTLQPHESHKPNAAGNACGWVRLRRLTVIVEVWPLCANVTTGKRFYKTGLGTLSPRLDSLHGLNTT